MSSPEQHQYADGPAQYGRLHRPDGDRSAGTVVVIHGGFWKAQYGLDLGEPLAADLARRGWTAWNIEYRRVGDGGGWPETFDDVAAAIDHLRTLDVDTNRVVTLGHSAGGHLATWAAARTRFNRWAGGVEVSHVVAQAGVLDLVQAESDGLGSGAVRGLMGGGPDEQPSAYSLADPTRHLPLDVPVTCVHAPDDDLVPIGQSRDYVANANAAGGDARLVETIGGHFGVIDVESPAWASCCADLLD